jgi:2-methylisocitrate lyase-like PEP mutase family enzyme
MGPTFQDAVESVEDIEDPFLLVLADADNGFNKMSLLNILWEVRHRWARGSCFAFNVYRHDA